MVEIEQLKKWYKEIHKTATEHGWHEEKHSPEHWLCLIISEVGEAVEADRKSYSPNGNLKGFDILIDAGHPFGDVYRDYVKGTVGEEFADIVIRLLDMAYEIHGEKMSWWGYYPCGARFCKDKSFSENVTYFVKDVLNYGTMNIVDSIYYIFEWAEYLEIDLVRHIELKMKYNTLRPYKHGGKKY